MKNPELVALEVLRKIQSAVVVGHVSLVKARLAPGPALFLLNNKKGELARLEAKYQVHIYILADGRLTQDEYEFELESKKLAPGEVAPPPPAAVKPPIKEEPEEDEGEDGDLDEIADEEQTAAKDASESSTEARHDRIKHRRLRFRPRLRRRTEGGSADAAAPTAEKDTGGDTTAAKPTTPGTGKQNR